MNHLEKKIREKYPSEDISVENFTIMRQPATVRCNICGQIYTLKQAQNFLRKDKTCICRKCQNDHSGGRLSKEDFQKKIDELYPDEELTVLNYTLRTMPCTIKCNRCGEQYTLQNAGSFCNSFKKRICKNCLPNKREIVEKSFLKFKKWTKEQTDYIFNFIPEKISSKTLIEAVCISCGKPSSKTIYDYLRGRKCKYCQKNVLKTLEEYQAEIGDEYTVLEYNGMSHRSKFRHNICNFIYIANSGAYLCPKCKGSKGERKIRAYLLKNQIDFEEQKIYLIQGHKLRADFYLPQYDIVIEYNGEQHYYPLDFFGGEETFKKRQLYDNYKRDYFKDKLFEISYLDYDILNQKLDDLLKNLKSSSTISKESKETEVLVS